MKMPPMAPAGEEQQPQTESEEAAAWQQRDRPRLKAVAEQGYIEQRTAAENLAHDAQTQQRKGEAESHTGSIEDRAYERVLRGEGFRPAEDDAVDDDEGNESAQRLVHIKADRLDEEVDDGDEGGDDEDEGGDAHLFRDDVAQQ